MNGWWNALAGDWIVLIRTADWGRSGGGRSACGRPDPGRVVAGESEMSFALRILTAQHQHVDESRQVRQRLRWFDEGAPQLRIVLDRLGLGDGLPAGQDYYACPCCLTCYPRGAVMAGELTEEHVPPKRLGGRGMVLTCVRCNNNSGTHFDRHAATRADADDFVRGRSTGRKLPVTAYLDDIPLRGTIEQTENGIRILGVVRADNYVRPGQAACRYSCRIPPRRSRRRIPMSSIRAGSRG